MKNYQFSFVQRMTLVLFGISVIVSQVTFNFSQTTNRPQPLINYADPFVGTENGGIFRGPSDKLGKLGCLRGDQSDS